MKIKTLDGIWKITNDKEDLLEKEAIMYKEDFYPDGWEEINVPSHWQKEGFDYQGIVWYYKKFTLPEDLYNSIEERVLLKFNGIDYLSQVWFNGAYLGAHEGDFDSFYYDISNYLHKVNRIFIKVESRLDPKPEFKETIKGGLYHWDCLPVKQKGLDNCQQVPSANNSRYPNPVVNPGGVWRSVFICLSKSFFLDEVRLTQHFHKGQENVYLKVEGKIYNWHNTPMSIEGKVKISPENFQGKSFAHTFKNKLKPGLNQLSTSMEIEQPVLWWCWDLGEPNLYQFQLICHKEDDDQSVEYKQLIGFREVKKGDRWDLYINGKRFFARGTNYLSNHYLSCTNKNLYDLDIEMIRNANMNMIRVFAHMEREYFYELCDREGILIWQDLPFQWGYDPGPFLIIRAGQIAERFVNKLYNHPSIFLWCCHSESRFHDYNKLDNIIKSKVSTLDPGRPVWKNSVFVAGGDLPVFVKDLENFSKYSNQYSSVDWHGWYEGTIEDIDNYNPLFVTEFGTQSLPVKESLVKILKHRPLWPPDLKEWSYRDFQLDIYKTNMGSLPDNLEDMIEITQHYQHLFYKKHVESLRRRKYDPVNGILQFHFVSPWPAMEWSIVDFYRQPKQAYFTVMQVFNPLLLCFTVCKKNNMIVISVWIINDYHRAYKEMILCWEVSIAGERVFKDRVKIESVKSDSCGIYQEKTLSPGSNYQTCVKGSLYHHEKLLSTNYDIFINDSL